MRRMIAVVIVGLTVCAAHVEAGLRVTPSAVDLGEIRGGPTREQRFVLYNDGNDVIEIVEVQRGCGCLEPTLDRRLLQPGEKATLRVVLRTAGQANGPRSWNLRVRYRAGDTVREELLILAGTVRNEVVVQPSILALEVREVLRQEVVVTDRRTPPLKVTGAQSSSPAIRATVGAAAGGVTKVLLEVTASALAEGRQDAVLSIYTDDPLYSPLQLPIALTRGVKPAVAVAPAEVALRVSAEQPIASALVRLRPAEGQKAVVETIESDDLGITCTWAAGPGNGATLRVRADASRLDRRDGPRSVHVRLAEPAGEVVRIPVVIER